MNTVDLDLPLRTQGRAAREVDCEIVRPLNAADLVLLDLEKGVAAKPLQRLRDSHHALARLLANGAKAVEAAAITGYSQSRISILQADPAFQELLAHYRGIEEATFIDVQNRVSMLTVDAMGELHERLIEEPERFNNDDLKDIMKLGLDRTGHGPATKSTNVNVNIDLAARVAAGRARAANLKVVQGTLANQRSDEPAESQPRRGDGGDA